MPSSTDAGALGQWQTLWGATYAGSGEVADPKLNLAGWVSSYTGSPIREAEMKDWVEHTAARILALVPRRVLEIGCGMGLLLLRVAPRCEEYRGLDFTPEAVAYVDRCLAADPIPGASVERRSADDLAELPAGRFDVIVLNSVIQYFPGRDYLLKALSGAIAAAAPEARIFLGDVRSEPLLRAFHTAVQLAQADPAMPLPALRERVDALVAAERELVFAPSYFSELSSVLPRLGRADVQVKRGRPRNELTRFRYDVVLHLDASGRQPAPFEWLTWGAEVASLAALKKHLSDSRPGALGVRGIPNARLAAELQAVELLAGGDGLATVADLEAAVRRARPSGVDPEDLYALEKAVPYRAEVTWSESGEDKLDAVFLAD